ncbi:MAG: N-acetylmuramoyl-L-alanine amidase-like domain-containing protein, partial [bacterium]
MRRKILAILALAILIGGCSRWLPWKTGGAQPAALSAEAAAVCDQLKLDKDKIAALEAKPLYQFSEEEVGTYLGYMQKLQPDLRKRIVRLGRKNIGQPYEIFLLGEFPFETYDPQPLYCLTKSDCVVFSEHTYAMALSHDWTSFFTMLQRIRYKNGQIGVATRNHYTEADWDVNNRWLVRDVTEELAPGATRVFHQKIDRAKFLKDKFKLETQIPVENFQSTYIPYEAIPQVIGKLRSGDFVNVMYGQGDSAYAGHTGLIAVADDGTVDFLHSAPPQVREQSLEEYIRNTAAKNEARLKKGNSPFAGFKFLRLEDHPIQNLVALDGPDAPHVSAPEGS